MSLGSHSGRAVAIVTGGSFPAGRDIACRLASWAWPVVVVYLEHQWQAEATVSEIIAAGGMTVAVRADLEDGLDTHRLFTESIAAFGYVDVVVHTVTGNATRLYEQAARYVRRGGAVVTTSVAEPVGPSVGAQLGELGITVGRVGPTEVLDFLERWTGQNTG